MKKRLDFIRKTNSISNDIFRKYNYPDFKYYLNSGKTTFYRERIL